MPLINFILQVKKRTEISYTISKDHRDYRWWNLGFTITQDWRTASFFMWEHRFVCTAPEMGRLCPLFRWRIISMSYTGQCFLFYWLWHVQVITSFHRKFNTTSNINVWENVSMTFWLHLRFLWMIIMNITRMFGKNALIFVIPFVYNAFAVFFLPS